VSAPEQQAMALGLGLGRTYTAAGKFALLESWFRRGDCGDEVMYLCCTTLARLTRLLEALAFFDCHDA
jgi:hypothetical protein